MKLLTSLVISMVVLSGCANIKDLGDVYHQAERVIGDDLTLLSASAQPIVRNPDGTICYGPHPDTTIDIDGAAGTKGVTLAAGDNELPIGGRNPNVLITRDIFFQSCLAEARLGLSNKERRELFDKTLETVAQINSGSLEGAYVQSDAASGQQVITDPFEGSTGGGSSY